MALGNVWPGPSMTALKEAGVQFKVYRVVRMIRLFAV